LKKKKGEHWLRKAPEIRTTDRGHGSVTNHDVCQPPRRSRDSAGSDPTTKVQEGLFLWDWYKRIGHFDSTCRNWRRSLLFAAVRGREKKSGGRGGKGGGEATSHPQRTPTVPREKCTNRKMVQTGNGYLEIPGASGKNGVGKNQENRIRGERQRCYVILSHEKDETRTFCRLGPGCGELENSEKRTSSEGRVRNKKNWL